MKREVWGPASPLAIELENQQRAESQRMAKRLAIYLYGRTHFGLRYHSPTYVLRRRATYGGRKGRAAIKRLKKLGCGPITTE